MTTPLILTAFANLEEEAHLEYLKDEESNIRELFYPLIGENILNLLPISHATSDDLYKALSKLKDRIQIIHYGGHADKFHLELENGKYKIRQFTEILRGRHDLNLVFLNGCSTEGLVDSLLNVGVKVVIATTQSIGDYPASKFAENFYNSFLTKGKNLEEAFYEAASDIKNWGDSDKIKYRDLDDDYDENSKNEMPWGLYLKEENKIILKKWILNDGKAKNGRPSIKTLWDELYEVYENLEKEANELRIKFEDASDLKILYEIKERGQELIEKKQKEIDEIKKDRENKSEESRIALKRLSELSTAKRDEERSRKLCSALNNINFTNEIDVFRGIVFPKIDSTLNLGAFIVQGSPRCGLELLRKRMIETAEIKANENKIFLFDFNARINRPNPTKHDIWKLLLDQIPEISIQRNVEFDEKKQNRISTEIFEKYLKSKDIILVFANMDKNPHAQNKKLIQEFWFTFSKHVRNYKQEQKAKKTSILPDKKILAFFIDNLCHLGNNEEELNLLRDYSKIFTKEEQEENKISILSLPKKMQTEYLKIWANEKGLPFTLDYNSILTDKGDYVLPTIKKICEFTKIIDYSDHFDPFPEIQTEEDSL